MIVQLGPYSGFILAAYGIAVAVVVALVAWVIADYRAQQRLLADLEARGVTRRSETKLETV